LGNARLSFDVGPGVRSDSDMGVLIAFFRARRGAARGFRLADPSDFSSNGMVAAPTSVDQVIGVGMARLPPSRSSNPMAMRRKIPSNGASPAPRGQRPDQRERRDREQWLDSGGWRDGDLYHAASFGRGGAGGFPLRCAGAL
jgi:hypothetical protein